jgi:hypothetical protein
MIDAERDEISLIVPAARRSLRDVMHFKELAAATDTAAVIVSVKYPVSHDVRELDMSADALLGCTRAASRPARDNLISGLNDHPAAVAERINAIRHHGIREEAPSRESLATMPALASLLHFVF